MKRLLARLGHRAMERLGIVYDEPFALIVDDVVVDALNDGASLLVRTTGPPVLLRPSSPAPAPINVRAPNCIQ